MILNIVKPNRYQDSVTLMQVAALLRETPGVDDASLMMGTEPNLEMLRDAGLLTPEGEHAGPNDLIVALSGEEAAVRDAGGRVEEFLVMGAPRSTAQEREEPTSLSAGLARMPEVNFVMISTPGIYAAAEARKALLQGRHVMIFSDNVSLGDEKSLKGLALERGLLLMGPDCGTAILGGVPLGFANVVRRGTIGVVGASGTGTQEVTTLIDRYGGGISQAIGTGSRDLSETIGGAMTLAGLQALIDDPSTEVIVLVSKPPHPEVARKVAAAAHESHKPVVLAFLGRDGGDLQAGKGRVTAARTLEEAARRAVELTRGGIPFPEDEPVDVSGLAARLRPEQRYVRGLFSGGTFCYEAMLVLQEPLGPVYSNTPLSPEQALPDPRRSLANTCIDLGSDEFTVGRPHPMIDMSTRVERIAQEAADPEVAVILLDIVLGFGAHPDPAGALAEPIRAALSRAVAEGRGLGVVATICGTPADPQGMESQRITLAEAGAVIASSNAAAARLAASIAARSGTPSAS